MSVRIYCHGHLTWAIKSSWGWFCDRCGQEVKVVT